MTTTRVPAAMRWTSVTAASRSSGDVGLVEDDDRRHAAVVGEHEVALQAPQVEVVVEAGDEEGEVHVGGQDLARAVRDAVADERSRPGQDSSQRGHRRDRADRLEGQPVAHRGQVRRRPGLTAEASLER